METIYDHNVTAEEIEACGFLDIWQRIRHGIDFVEPIDKEQYLNKITVEAAIFDIALLLEHRKQSARKYWKKIPERAQKYKLGFDYKMVAVDE